MPIRAGTEFVITWRIARTRNRCGAERSLGSGTERSDRFGASPDRFQTRHAVAEAIAGVAPVGTTGNVRARPDR